MKKKNFKIIVIICFLKHFSIIKSDVKVTQNHPPSPRVHPQEKPALLAREWRIFSSGFVPGVWRREFFSCFSHVVNL